MRISSYTVLLAILCLYAVVRIVWIVLEQKVIISKIKAAHSGVSEKVVFDNFLQGRSQTVINYNGDVIFCSLKIS